MEKCFGYYFDRKVALIFKGKFQPTTIRLKMVYGTECWAVKI